MCNKEIWKVIFFFLKVKLQPHSSRGAWEPWGRWGVVENKRGVQGSSLWDTESTRPQDTFQFHFVSKVHLESNFLDKV